MTLFVTDAGKNLIIEAMANPDDAKIVFTGMILGNGDGSEADASITSLMNPLNTLEISEITRDTTFANVKAILNNSTVSAGYKALEIGINTYDTDGSTEILFAYGYTDESSAMYIPAAGDYSLESTLVIKVYVGDAEDVSAVISESLAFVTKAVFENHIGNYSNPHKVTKAQVGLGNVENKSINNQTPTYTENTDLEALSSGETLETALGKIATAVKRLIAHIKDTTIHISSDERTAWNNKAEKSHTHSTADITSGVLGVARGGTGVESYQALSNELAQYFLPIVGHYSGNNVSQRFIELGFTPSLLIVSDSEEGPAVFGELSYGTDSDGDAYGDSEYYTRGGIATTGYNALIPTGKTIDSDSLTSWVDGVTAIMIGENEGSQGFFVGYNTSRSYYGTVATNQSGHIYTYIAFRTTLANAVVSAPADTIGTYIGDGASGSGASQVISLDYTPSFVLIYTGDTADVSDMTVTQETPASYGSTVDATDGFYGFAPNQNLYHAGCGNTYYSSSASAMFARGHGGAAVVDGGFAVQYYSKGQDVNTNGKTYTYFAWK